MAVSEALVFDTGPLSHFGRESWLGVLKVVVGKRTAVIPDVVMEELRRGAIQDSRIQTVLDAPWIERRELRSDDEIVAFAEFSALLVKDTHNRGEAGVLALASPIGGIAVIDDGAARKAAGPGNRAAPHACPPVRGDSRWTAHGELGQRSRRRSSSRRLPPSLPHFPAPGVRVCLRQTEGRRSARVTVQRAGDEGPGSSREVSRDELLRVAKPFPTYEEMVLEELTDQEADAFWAAINEM